MSEISLECFKRFINRTHILGVKFPRKEISLFAISRADFWMIRQIVKKRSCRRLWSASNYQVFMILGVVCELIQ